MLRISFMVIISLVYYNCESVITKNKGIFQFCVPIDSLIELSISNTDFQLLNQPNFLKSFHTEFSLIKLFTNEIMTVYSLGCNFFFATQSCVLKCYINEH